VLAIRCSAQFGASGFHTNTSVFFDNLPTILLHAIVGTLLNTFMTGWVMWHVGEATLGSGANFRLVDAFLFGSFISAVDPVAVLAVFEKAHVDATIHGVVAGESTLNDGLAVVLYYLFVAVAYSESMALDQFHGGYGYIVLWFLYRFVYVFGMGVLIGIVCGIVAPANLLYIDASYKSLQPITLLAWAMASFAFAEFVHASGIIAVMCYGMLIKNYAIRNLAVYGDFDIIFGPFLAYSPLYTTPHAPWSTLYLVPMLIWC